MAKKQQRRDFLKQFGIAGTGLYCFGASAMGKQVKSPASGFENVGDMRTWKRQGGAVVFDCSKKQKVKINVLTDSLFRVQFTADGVFKPSELIDWGLVKPDDSFTAPDFKLVDRGGAILLDTSEIEIVIRKSPFRITVLDKQGKILTEEGSEGMTAGEGARFQMKKSEEEHFFGMGQGIGTKNPDAPFTYYRYPQYGNVSVHGTQLDQAEITLDQTGKKTFFCLGPNWSGQCMAPAVIPFFMSTNGYGIYLNNFRDSVFDLDVSNGNSWSINLGGAPNHVPNTDSLDYYFINGPSFKKILNVFTDLTGKTPILPKWSLGFFQICHFDQIQSDVIKIAEDFRNRDFPCDTLLLEPGWTKTPYRMDGWSPERFPDPVSMIAELTKLGFKLGLWQCGPADWVFTSWDLLKRNLNEWGIDITNPAEVEKYKSYHNLYFDQGIAFFKQDGCGQSEWVPEAQYQNGMTGRELHNVIPTLYSKIMDEGYREHNPNKRYVNFNPMVGPSHQRYPGIWPSGDSGGGYEMFVGEMNLGLSGHTYTSHDFADRSPAGIHWSLLGPFMPGALCAPPQGEIPGIKIQNKAHSDALTVNMCQFYLKMRYKLIPYIYNTHRQAHQTGTPYMRAMVLEFQDDPVSYSLDHQCMLGDSFLIAAYTKDVYLPEGKWFDYWSGEEFDSTGEWKEDFSFPARVGGPLLVKGGAIIPMGQVMSHVDKEPWEIVELDIYPFKRSACSLYEDDGSSYDYEKGGFATTDFQCIQSSGTLEIKVGKRMGTYSGMPENRSFLISVHTTLEPSIVKKGPSALIRYSAKEELIRNGNISGWAYDKEKRILWIKSSGGWYFGPDERPDDPEKDTVYWVGSEKHEDNEFKLTIS